MTRKTLTAALATAIAAAAGCASDETDDNPQSSLGARDSSSLGLFGGVRDDGDEAVTLEECPEPVQATIKARMNGGAITELERTTDHGEVLYEVDVKGDGGIVEFDVAEDGTFRGYEGPDDDDDAEDDDGDDEHEEEIPLSDVPDLVMNAAELAVPGIVIEEAERETENGATIYCLEGEADGLEYEIEVSADGAVLETEIEDDDGEGGDEDEDED